MILVRRMTLIAHIEAFRRGGDRIILWNNMCGQLSEEYGFLVTDYNLGTNVPRVSCLASDKLVTPHSFA